MWTSLTRFFQRFKSARTGRAATSPQAVQTALLQLASLLQESLAFERKRHSLLREPLEANRRLLETEGRHIRARLGSRFDAGFNSGSNPELNPALDSENRLIMEDIERQLALNSALLDGHDERQAQLEQALWSRQRHLGLDLIGRLESLIQARPGSVDHTALKRCFEQLEQIALHPSPVLPSTSGLGLSAQTLHPLEHGTESRATTSEVAA